MSVAQDYSASLRKYINVVVHEGASDLHIRVGTPPVIRVHGILHRVESVMFMTQRRLSDLECLKFDAGQKLVERARVGGGVRVRKIHVAVRLDRRVINRRERSKGTHGSYNARASAAVDPLSEPT